MSHFEAAAIAIACRMRWLDKSIRSKQGFTKNLGAEAQLRAVDRMVPVLQAYGKENGGFPQCPKSDELANYKSHKSFDHFAKFPYDQLEFSLQGCAFWVSCPS